MKALVARIALVVLLVLASPVVTFAHDGDEAIWWDWFVRMIIWGSGGWHGF